MEKFKLKIERLIKEQRIIVNHKDAEHKKIIDINSKHWSSGRIAGMLDVIIELEKICNEKM